MWGKNSKKKKSNICWKFTFWSKDPKFWWNRGSTDAFGVDNFLGALTELLKTGIFDDTSRGLKKKKFNIFRESGSIRQNIVNRELQCH